MNRQLDPGNGGRERRAVTLRRSAVSAALLTVLVCTACGGPEEPVHYEDLVVSGRLAVVAGAEAGGERWCADETRFAVALSGGTEVQIPLVLGKSPHLAVAACRPPDPETAPELASSPAGSPPAGLHVAVLGQAGPGSELQLPVADDGWAEGSLDLSGLAGARAILRLRVDGPEAGEVLVSDLWVRHRREDRASGDPPRAPNGTQILLISVDTLRADALGGAAGPGGAAGAVTPGLAAFAEGAEAFSPHYAAASWTKPSHATLLTGLPTEAHGAILQDQGLSPTAATLAERFSAAGLRTAGLVYDTVWLDPKFGFDRGFDEYRVKPWNADQAVRFTTSWIARHRREPFFYFLHVFTPHSDKEILPYEATGVTRETVAERFALAGYGCRRRHCASRLLLAINAGRVAPLPVEEEVLRFLYARGVETVDRALARLFADLEEQGLLDRMLVVVTSDHGEAFFEHGRLLHSTHHEEILRVPLLVRWPGGERAGEVRTTPTAAIDLAPTLLRGAGLETGGLPGIPLQDPPERGARRRELFAGTVTKAVMVGPWKALFSMTEAPPELYRLDRDPGETRNLAAEHPQVLAELRERVSDHVKAAQSLTGARGVSEIPSLTSEERRRLKALGYVD